MEFTKPECRNCKDDNIPAEFAENLAYHIFNPYAMDRGDFNVKNFIKQKIDDEELAENFDSYSTIFNDMMRNFGYAEALWMDKFEKYVEAKSKAWEEIKEKLRSGELKIEDINFKELLDYFFEEALKELIEMGIIEGVTKRFFRRKVKFSKQAERIIAEKVMKEVSKEAKGYYAESEGETLSYIPGYELVEYDEYLHSYDLIDIPETMIRAAKNEDFEIREKDIVSRKPKKVGKRHFVMLIDVSDSMRGKKIIGAIEAALALKMSIRKGFDDLEVFVFNHRTEKIKEGDIVNVDVEGRTDIALALKTARNALRGKDGAKYVILITDGEPTASYNPLIPPWKMAVIESAKLKDEDINLNVLMLNDDSRFYALCERMLKAAGKGSIFYFPNPLNLKNYIYSKYRKK